MGLRRPSGGWIGCLTGWALLGQAFAAAPAPTALPTGPQVTQGAATVSTTVTPSTALLTVQQATPRAVINWTSFDIGAQSQVRFSQPDAASVALNRVSGATPSQIDGLLQANGQVFVINPSGVLFGRNAQVNVHGLVASTLDLGDTDFMAGRLNFSGQAGVVSNAGVIATDGQPGGYVALLGGQVSNTGSVTAQLGSVALAAGRAMTLDFAGDGLLRIAVPAGAAGALVEQLGTVAADGGRVVLSAQSADALISAVVRTSGLTQARGLQGRGGEIELVGDVVSQSGTLDVSGPTGGLVTLSARSALLDGTIRADGTQGVGGQIGVTTTQTLLQTRQSTLSASGATAGGQITLQGGGADYLSGRLLADGAVQGGQVSVSTDRLVMAGTELSAAGAGGRVVAWSQGDTFFNGAARAGNATSAGFIEISGLGTLTMGGTVDPGLGGQTLLDPANIVIGSPVSPLSYIDLINPNLAASLQHGNGGVIETAGGNVAVASPLDNFGNTAAGAVFLYNGTTGALISALYGNRANDQVGAGGLTRLTNGNFVASSPFWNGGDPTGMGAVTWGSGLTGVSGTVSAANSLVGLNAGDLVSAGGVTALSNGNYVVCTPDWGGGAGTPWGLGAITWGNGLGGTVGPVTAANSLVGAAVGDLLGSGGVTALANGNYVISSPDWGSGGQAGQGLGAATWMSGTTVGAAAVSSANSLIGNAAGDQVSAGGVTALTNGHYVISSPNWNGNIGAVTWGDGLLGLTGVLGAPGGPNSLIGAQRGDQVGAGGVTALSNGNYVVSSPNWGGNTGAATWMDGTAAGAGAVVTAANSLVGAQAGDRVGSGGVTALIGNGNYVVSSPNWSGNLGAATWGSGTAGVVGAISSTNSLTGSIAGDWVGVGGVTALSNGHYVVNSPAWGGGDPMGLGAVTWGNGWGGTTGPVLTANSITGAVPGDQIGTGGVTALSNGNFVISSPDWGSGGGVNGIGAVTWVNGSVSSAGTVSAANSMTGGVQGDLVGSGGVTALANGNYVISSPNWSLGTGAATWANGTLSTSGTVSAVNSLVGHAAGDFLSSGGITGLVNSSYVIDSPSFSPVGGPANAGAVWLVTGGIVPGPDYTPSQLAALAPAGTTLTLAATNNITVNAAATVAGSLVLNAGTALTLNAGLTSTAPSTSALVMSAGQSFVNNAGANALSTPNGNWQIWSATPANDRLGGLVAGFKQYNATLGVTAPAQATGNGLFYTVAPTLTARFGGTATKVYDGTTTAPSAGLNLTATGGAVFGDVITGLTATSFDFVTRNVGTGLNILASGVTATAVNGTMPVYGYQITPNPLVEAGGGTITPAPLSVAGTAVAGKVYDATTAATFATPGQLVGLFGTDQVSLTQTAVFASKNVNPAQTVNLSNTVSGADAGNYLFGPATQQLTAAIAPAPLGVTGTVVAGKVYDGTTGAQVTPGVLGGVFPGDVVTLNQTGSFADPGVGLGKSVTVSSTLGGPSAGNYVLPVATLVVRADITPPPVPVQPPVSRPVTVLDLPVSVLAGVHDLTDRVPAEPNPPVEAPVAVPTPQRFVPLPTPVVAAPVPAIQAREPASAEPVAAVVEARPVVRPVAAVQADEGRSAELAEPVLPAAVPVSLPAEMAITRLQLQHQRTRSENTSQNISGMAGKMGSYWRLLQPWNARRRRDRKKAAQQAADKEIRRPA